MKKIIVLLICGVMLFGLCGCGKNEEYKFESDKTNDKKTIGNYLYKKTIQCDILNNIKYIYNDYLSYYIVTNDNQFYLLSIDKLYSNNMNCKKVENFDFLMVKNNYIIDKQGYEYGTSYDDKTFGKISNTPTNSYNTLKNGDITKIETQGTSTKLFILSKNGSIYEEEYNRNGIINITNKEIIKIENEKIKDFYMDLNTLDFRIKYLITDKSFLTYTEIITNEEECNKYADIKCEKKYEWIKNEDISSKIDELVAVLPWILINKNGDVFINVDIYREFFGG